MRTVIKIYYSSDKFYQMIDRNNRRPAKRRTAKLSINGLHITPDSVQKVDRDVEYSFADLDLLLTQHKDAIHMRLFDDRYLEAKTINVIEFKGEPFVISKN